MDYLTKWLAYAITNQEASTVAEALVANFFCHFGIPRDLHSDHGRNFESRLLQVLQRVGVKRAPRPGPAVGRHGGALHQDGRGALEKGCRIPPEGLRREITPLSPSLQGIHSRQYGRDTSLPSVRARTATALRPTVWNIARQGTTHNRSCGRLSGPFT
jgi:hypothetical protein